MSLQDSIAEWLDGLLSGKVRTGPLQQLPDFPDTEAAAADAAAAPEAPVEEEFDLNDIMNVRARARAGCGAVAKLQQVQGGPAGSCQGTLTKKLGIELSLRGDEETPGAAQQSTVWCRQ